MPLTTESAARKDRRVSLADAPPRMTHQHFAYLAAVVRAMPSHAPNLRAQKESVTSALAEALRLTNPNFSRARFVAACQSEGEE